MVIPVFAQFRSLLVIVSNSTYISQKQLFFEIHTCIGLSHILGVHFLTDLSTLLNHSTHFLNIPVARLVICTTASPPCKFWTMAVRKTQIYNFVPSSGSQMRRGSFLFIALSGSAIQRPRTALWWVYFYSLDCKHRPLECNCNRCNAIIEKIFCWNV